MKKLVILMLVFLTSFNMITAQSGISDEDQIKQIINKLCEMWTDPNGIELARSITAKNVISIGQNGSMNRDEYLQMLSMVFKNISVERNTHEIYKMKILDNSAYEHGMITLKMKNGLEQKLEVLNVFIKEDKIWKFYGTLQADIIKGLF